VFQRDVLLDWRTVLECLCAHFPAIPHATWLARMQAGRVLDEDGLPLASDAAYHRGATVHYFREVDAEAPMPAGERILHADEHLVVADKPHVLPVTPAGRFVRETLLARLLAEPYFAQQPPKSTGRDLFHTGWLDAVLQTCGRQAEPVDVQATLAELTARAATEALVRHSHGARQLLVCGGGAFNGHLMRRLSALAPGVEVLSTGAKGVPPDQVEALAFAWLARQFIDRRPGNLPAVTGARGTRVLGALHPA
jgi:hypothetical protein